jgi:hypothetical protein
MNNFKLATPVAFIIFNRPDTTERVFAEIAKAKPPQLLVVGDGPRANRQGDAEKVAATRAIIQQVDWDCEVITNFSDVNLGCKKRVSSGIDWIFEQVEEAIILEDDCLPDPSFFRYCQEMLERYRQDQRIGMISGDNFQFGRSYGDDSYYFSKYVHIWGWATWRDRWVDSYDVNIAKWPRVRDEGRMVDMVEDVREARYWEKIFERVYLGRIDTWDYQWVFSNWIEGRISIMPSRNLISNIGFGVGATHTTGASDVADLPVFTLKFPLTHPVGIFRNIRADAVNYKICFRVPFIKRVYGKLVGIMRVKLSWFR